jgi:hypothetical protein
MNGDPTLIADLIRAGTDPDLVQRVALEIGRLAAADAAIERRRTTDKARQARLRSRDITLDDVTERDSLPLEKKSPQTPKETTPHPESEGGEARAREAGQASDWPDDFAAQTWEAYGQGREKKVSMQALLELKRARKVPWQVFLDGVRRQAENVEVQFRPSLQRFIKREKWCDEYTPTVATGPPQQSSQRSLALVPVNGHQAHAIREDRKPNPIGTLLGRIEARAARKRERGAFGGG